MSRRLPCWSTARRRHEWSRSPGIDPERKSLFVRRRRLDGRRHSHRSRPGRGRGRRAGIARARRGADRNLERARRHHFAGTDRHPSAPSHFAVRQAPLVDIMTAVSHEDIVRRIADRAKSAPAGEWIMTTPVGEPHYFIRRTYKDMEEGELPTRHVLDRATNQHPVAIQAWEPNIPNTAVFNSLAQ